MRLKKTMEDGVAVLRLNGNLTGGADAERFQTVVKETLEADVKKILVDFGEVPWINSSGLGILIAAYTSISREAGAMKLSRLSKRNHHIFVVARLDRIFETFDSTEAALATFGEIEPKAAE